MYPKFKEIALDTATWTVAFLGAIEERETKSKKPFCTFHLLDGDIALQSAGKECDFRSVVQKAV